MKVFWTDTATQHLSSIYGYIAQNSPQYAQQVIDRLTKRSHQIANFPLPGRVVREFETEQIREVIEGAYRIISTSNSIKLIFWQSCIVLSKLMFELMVHDRT